MMNRTVRCSGFRPTEVAATDFPFHPTAGILKAVKEKEATASGHDRVILVTLLAQSAIYGKAHCRK